MYWSMFFVFLFTVALRVLPMRFVPHGSGVDQWYWRSYIERVRDSQEFPPRLTQFRLEEAQWYPPLFPLLLAKLPGFVFERYAGYFAVLLDLLRMLMLMCAAKVFSGSEQVAVVSGLVYALTPVLTTYNIQLNPRGLGALLLDATWLCVAGALLWGGGLGWLLAAIFGGLMLLTHKMTTQLFVFTACVAAVLLGDASFLVLIPMSVLVAFGSSRGFYRLVFRHHLDIVQFWFKNWQWMGSNPILESPVYGDPGFESPSKYYRSGWWSASRRLAFVVGFNPWMPAVLLVAILLWWYGHTFSLFQLLALSWLAINFAFALLTTLIPFMRCFGQGYLYGYNGSFPAALSMGLIWLDIMSSWYVFLICVVTAVASVVALLAFFRTLASSRTLKVDRHLNEALLRLKELPPGVVMCLPQHWHDAVAYRAGKPVAFGGHGYGFRLLQPVFPRLLVTVRQFIKDNAIAYLLIWPAYVNRRFLDDLPAAEIEEFGDYKIYKFTPFEERYAA